MLRQETRKVEGDKKFYELINLCLCTESRVQNFMDSLDLIESFEDKYYLLAMRTQANKLSGRADAGIKLEKVGPSELEEMEKINNLPTQSENVDHAYLFLPFWDTKIDDTIDDNATQLRKQLSISAQEASLIRIATHCNSIRSFIAH